MKLFVSIYNDVALLGPFLEHYSSLGISNFMIATHPCFADAIRNYRTNYNIVLYTNLDVEDSLYSGSLAVTSMRKQQQAEDEWCVIVDLDEFLMPRTQIESLLTDADRLGRNVIRGVMVDRFSAKGGFPMIKADTDMGKIMPVGCRFIRDVMGGCDQKGVLVKGLLLPEPHAGHHRFQSEWVYTVPLEIAHYKWIHGALDRLKISYGLLKSQNISWVEEYKRAIDAFESNSISRLLKADGLTPSDLLNTEHRCEECEAIIDYLEAAYSMQHAGCKLCRRHQGDLTQVDT